MPKIAYIIVGLGYGDEGKGLVTDYYCKDSSNPIVIRFNGGQQAGHTVFLKTGKKHVFSNFGSGTLRNIPTFWSKYCTFSPGFFLDELKVLKITPQFFIDSFCPVTTHYDILYNRIIETYRGIKRHGSCGLGFGATINRHKELSIKLIAADLLLKQNCSEKLSLIREYYKKKIQKETNYLFSAFDHDKEDKEFFKKLEQIEKLASDRVFAFASERDVFGSDSKWHTYIFEGAQGILLDVNFGQQPYVTKSNTTSQNALEMLNRNFAKSNVDIKVAYVTRCYHTRHGEGPFRSGHSSLTLKNASHETNIFNTYQGVFRKGYLDLDLLNYAVRCDRKYSKKLPKDLFITCLDQIDCSIIPVYIQNRKHNIGYEMIQLFIDCDFDSVHYSFSKISDNLV